MPGETLIWGHRRRASFLPRQGLPSLFAPLVFALLLVGRCRPPRHGLVILWRRALTIAASWVMRYFTQYTITTKRLQIRRGILSKTETGERRPHPEHHRLPVARRPDPEGRRDRLRHGERRPSDRFGLPA
jgi:hypothetical protein